MWWNKQVKKAGHSHAGVGVSTSPPRLNGQVHGQASMTGLSVRRCPKVTGRRNTPRSERMLGGWGREKTWDRGSPSAVMLCQLWAAVFSSASWREKSSVPLLSLTPWAHRYRTDYIQCSFHCEPLAETPDLSLNLSHPTNA